MFSAYNFKALLGFLIITGLMFSIFFFATEMPKKQSVWGTWMSHTQVIISKIESLNSYIAQAEAEQRGFLLSQDPANLKAYQFATKNTRQIISDLRRLTTDNPVQMDRVNELDQSIQRHFLYLDSLIYKYDASKSGYAKDKNYFLAVKERKTETDPLLRQMREEEDRLLVLRTNEWKDAVLNSKTSVTLILIFLYLFICFTYLLGVREMKERKRLMLFAQKAAEAEKREASRFAEIVRVQNEISGHHMDLTAAMQLMADHTKNLTSAEHSVVEQIDGDFLVYTAVSEGSPADSAVGTRLPLDGSLSGRCIRDKAVLICEDVETDDRVNREMCRKLSIRSMVVVPLVHHDDPVGVIKVYSSKPNAFSQKDVTTLELMAKLLSATIGDAQATEKLAALATTDGLTNLKNHRAFKEAMVSEFERSRRYKHPLSVILLDVDHFKTFNDTYGHPAGDVVLKEVANLVKHSARDCDFVARYGGEEFAVMLPETTAEGAMLVAERIRQTIADAKWTQRAITVSVGLSVLVDKNVENYSSLIDTADKALYASKHGGRNRVTLFEPQAA